MKYKIILTILLGLFAIQLQSQEIGSNITANECLLGHTYAQHGNRINLIQMRDIMVTNEEAYDLMRTSLRRQIYGIIAASMASTSIYTSYSVYKREGYTNVYSYAIPSGFLALAAIFFISSDHVAYKAYQTYNKSYTYKNIQSRIYFSVGVHDAGLIINF